MVSVHDAEAIVLANPYKPHPVSVNITDAGGKTLAEYIRADRDFPPFHRVAMDGIAIRYDEWRKGTKEFRITQVQPAGVPQKRMDEAGTCLEVMTGAVLPEGADTVIRYEDLEVKDKTARVIVEDIRLQQHIHALGQDARMGDILLEPGMLLSPAEIALLASVGKSNVQTFSYPKAAIVASGDELVDINTNPQHHQIRRSNSYAIQAAMKESGWQSKQFHLPDQKELLRESLRAIAAEHDVIILSGGVSKGKFDYVPEVLTDIGIKKLFHQVSQRPGKPFWFGCSENGKTVFALPGNPVSTFMCFQRYIKPWYLESIGIRRPFSKVRLGTDFSFEPKLTYFLQVKVENEDGVLTAYPDAGGGSGDFVNLKDVDGFLELPLEKSVFKTGEVFPYIPFRDSK